MECLNNFIGIERRLNETITGSLYLEDTGINEDFGNALNETSNSGIDWLRNKITFANNAFLQKLRNAMQHKIKNFYVLESNQAGYFKPNKPVLSAEPGNLKGVYIRTVNSSFISLGISRIGLFANTTGDVDIFVYDVYQGRLIDTITVSAVLGEMVYIDVNKNYYTQYQEGRYFIGFNSSIETIDTNLYDNETANRSCQNCGRSGQYYEITGRKVSTGLTVVNNNLQTMNGTAGLFVEFNVECTISQYVCRHKKIFETMLFHNAAYEILNSVSLTERINSRTFNTDQVQAAAQMHLESLEKQLEDYVTNWNRPVDVCFLCNPAYKKETQLP